MKAVKVLSLAMILAPIGAMAASYAPVAKKGLIITRSGITCDFYKDFADTKGKIDVCNGGASVDIRVDFSQMRSIAASSSEGATEDKKYVSFIVGESSGAGFKVSNSLVQGHSRFDSWTVRDDYLGGFARDYTMKIEPIRGYTPRIHKHLPQNENKKYQHRDTTGFTIGVNGSVGAEVGKEGPKASAEVGASYTYTNSKTVVYDSQDYKIVNRTGGSTFNVAYEYDVNLCNSGNDNSGTYGCTWVAPLWGSDYVYDKDKISPIAYANFQPSMEVIYEAPPEEKGSTTFRITAGFKPQMLFGEVRYGAIYQVAGGIGQKWYNFTTPLDVTVDWGHPLFEPEAHVKLQSLDTNDACLDVQGGSSEPGTKVIAYSCHTSKNQVWGLDTLKRYKSRVADNLCLTANNDLSVTVEECNSTLSQKWNWNGNKLESLLPDPANNGDKYVLDTSEYAVKIVKSEDSRKPNLMPVLTTVNF
ncbi:leukocidin family pore-forming toxin [Vibrio alginolyticus]|uniref:leukocidin family pore-forming toxin n=1 Tax=Vibrio alginolyticus TaxID=663 RepID=UPI001EFE7098|nr:leukocidin family pore-forming toxin [Vibrio alginolyticus]MCG9766625.1 leukocidin family pore-forming toxin [Vibrio alginolyticus]